jgi:hypothetical protein
MAPFPNPETGFNKFMNENFSYNYSTKHVLEEFIMFCPHFIDHISPLDIDMLIQASGLLNYKIPDNTNLYDIENYYKIKGEILGIMYYDWHEENRPRDMKIEVQRMLMQELSKDARSKWDKEHGITASETTINLEGLVKKNELDKLKEDHKKELEDLKASLKDLVKGEISNIKIAPSQPQIQPQIEAKIEKPVEEKKEEVKPVKNIEKVDVKVKRDWGVDVDLKNNVLITEQHYSNTKLNTALTLDIDEDFAINWNVFTKSESHAEMLYSRLKELILQFLAKGEVHTDIIVHKPSDAYTFYPEYSDSTVISSETGNIIAKKGIVHELTIRFSNSFFKIYIESRDCNNMIDGLKELISQILCTGEVYTEDKRNVR